MMKIDVFRQNMHDMEAVSFGFNQPRLIGNNLFMVISATLQSTLHYLTAK